MSLRIRGSGRNMEDLRHKIGPTYRIDRRTFFGIICPVKNSALLVLIIDNRLPVNHIGTADILDNLNLEFLRI